MEEETDKVREEGSRVERLSQSLSDFSFSTLLPNLPHLIFGRDEEVRSFLKAIPHKNIFCVQGIPGIGKTFFMLHLARLLNERETFHQFHGQTFFIEAKPDWHSQTIIESMYNCLQRIEVKVPSPSDSDVYEPVKEKIATLIGLLNAGTFAFFIDDFHFLPSEERRELLHYFHRYLKASKVILSSCVDLEFSPLEKLEIWHKNLLEVSTESSKAFFLELLENAGEKSVSKKELETIFVKTSGHPFTIKLLASFFIITRENLKELHFKSF